MTSNPLFETGRHEVSTSAAKVAKAIGVDATTLFDRHAHGDWGDAPGWLQNDNRNAASLDQCSHTIRSHYRINDQLEFLVVTSRDRTRTKLILSSEFNAREVGIQEGYAAWAATYDFPNPLVRVEEPVVEAILAKLPPLSNAVDVGTGTGRLALMLARKGIAKVTGVDATPEMLSVARQSALKEGLANISFEQAVLGEESLPFDSGSVDLVTSGLMLCHLPNLRFAIVECVRLLRPGGRLLLSDFHPSTASFGWRTDFIDADGFFLLPNTRNTRQDYLDALTDAGCEILEVHDIALGGEPYGDLSEEAMRRRGWPPLCLVILASKPS